MPKINVYLPDELAEAVKETGVPVSAVCQRALEQAVRRITALREVTTGPLDGDRLATRLPQFTQRARTVLTLAAERAAAADSAGTGTTAGSGEAGTGDLLHGLLAEGGNLGLQVLQALEITPERLARDLSTSMGTPGRRAPGQAATSGPRTPDPTASATGPEPAQPFGPTRNGNSPADSAPARDAAGSPRLSASAAQALELAVAEATAFGHNYVGCEHLLLGLIAEPDGSGGGILRAAGAELRLTRRAVAAALAGLVHLRSQLPGTATGLAPAAGDTSSLGARSGLSAAQALDAVLQQRLAPLIQRIERLETARP